MGGEKLERKEQDDDKGKMEIIEVEMRLQFPNIFNFEVMFLGMCRSLIFLSSSHYIPILPIIFIVRGWPGNMKNSDLDIVTYSCTKYFWKREK